MSRATDGVNLEQLSPEERADYEFLTTAASRPTDAFATAHPKVKGDRAYGIATDALEQMPSASAALHRYGTALMSRPAAGTWTDYDHEIADLVVAFEAGTIALLGVHLPLAVGTGVRLEVVEALRQGSEGDLTEEEAQEIGFVRGVLRGTVDDASWAAMKARLGTDRGVVEFVGLILHLFTRMRMWQAFNEEPDFDWPDLDEMIAGIRDGSWQVGDVAGYVASRMGQS